MSYIDFAELKANLAIEDAIQLLGVPLKKRGDAFRGPCPTCRSGGNRALVVTPAKQAFYCFGAKTGGDVIALAAHLRGCDMKGAAEFLTGKGSDPEPGDKKANGSTVPEERTKEAARSLRPLSYLEAEHSFVQKLGLDEQTCTDFGAGYASKGIMRGRLAIPIHDGDGVLTAYCGRALKGEEPMLIFPRDFEPDAHLFNAHQITSDDLVLVRDPLDALIATQNGVDNVVSSLTETLSANQLRMLADLMEQNDCQAVELY
jgi:DNA primase